MMKFGIRAHDLGHGSADDIARWAAEHKMDVVQLAPTKALADLADPARLTPAYAREVAAAFARQNVGIAVLGCYINLVHPDAAVRQQEILRFKRYLRLARDFGCPVVGTEAGSWSGGIADHPHNRSEEAFAILLDNLADLEREARACDVTIALEAAAPYVIADADSMLRALDALPSGHLGIIYDPVNLLNAANHTQHEVLFDDFLDRLGPRMLAMHVKDYCPTEGGGMQVLPSGKGLVDYAYLLRRARKFAPDLPVIMEDNCLADMDESLAYLRRMAASPEKSPAIRKTSWTETLRLDTGNGL